MKTQTICHHFGRLTACFGKTSQNDGKYQKNSVSLTVPGSQDAACGRSRRRATSPGCAWPPVPSPVRHGSRAWS